jgi:integrase
MPDRRNSIIRLLRPLGHRAERVPKGGWPPTPLPRYLSQEELGRFHRAVVTGGSVRDIAPFGLMYRFGLRATETTNILLEDINLARSRIRILRAKGGDAKEYPLPRDVVPALRRFVRKRADKGPFLFTGRESNNQHGIRVLQVQRLFKMYAANAGLPPVVASQQSPTLDCRSQSRRGFRSRVRGGPSRPYLDPFDRHLREGHYAGSRGDDESARPQPTCCRLDVDTNPR